MTDIEVKGWFSENPHPSVTRLCLDFGIDPVELKGLAEVDPVVCRALWGIIAAAEEMLYERVYGPQAVIKRVELYLPVNTSDAVEDNDGLYATG